MAVLLPGICAAAVGPSADPEPIQRRILSIPDAAVIRHAQVRLGGDLQYFSNTEITVGDSAGSDTGSVPVFQYQSEMTFGVDNRAEFTVAYGRELSLGLKALLVEEAEYWPAVTFGVRNLFSSGEAQRYGVTERSLLRSLRGESYFTLGKRLTQSTRAHLGMNLLNGANKNPYGLHGALDMDLGAGAALTYEFFERFSDFHQNLGFSWGLGSRLGAMLTLTEFQSWVRQKGEWGFFATPAHTLDNGYNSPGVRFSLWVNGFMPSTRRRTQHERITVLEQENRGLREDMERLEQQWLAVKIQQEAMRPQTAVRPSEAEAEAEYRLLVEAYRAEPMDPAAVAARLEALQGLGRAAVPFLQRMALDPTASSDHRLPAVLAMAQSENPAFGPTLLTVAGDPDPLLRREAAMAMLKLRPPEGLEALEILSRDADKAVALTAQEGLKVWKNTANAVLSPEAEKKSPSH